MIENEIFGGAQMKNKHGIEEMKHLKILHAGTLETVHTHTHTLCLPNK